MAVLGKLLKNRRAGQAGLAWSSPNLAGPDTLVLTSPKPWRVRAGVSGMCWQLLWRARRGGSGGR
jgi:hypothetical protein